MEDGNALEWMTHYPLMRLAKSCAIQPINMPPIITFLENAQIYIHTVHLTASVDNR